MHLLSCIELNLLDRGVVGPIGSWIQKQGRQQFDLCITRYFST